MDKEKFIKARLCARGFEEEQHFRTDSPTCSRQDFCLTCSMIASNKWSLNLLDVKSIGIITCFVSDVLWGANEEFSYIIKQLESTFKIVVEHKEMFEYVRVHP